MNIKFGKTIIQMKQEIFKITSIEPMHNSLTKCSQELQNILFLPNDTINNSADDQHISIEKYALPKRAANTTIN